MSRQEEQSRQRRCGDVRLKGFSDRASFDEAIAWLDVHGRHGLSAEDIEDISVDAAQGRVIAEPIAPRRIFPPWIAREWMVTRSARPRPRARVITIRFSLLLRTA